MHAESKLAIAFVQHQHIASLMKTCNADIGDICKDSDTVRNMNEVLSEIMHEDLLQILQNGDHPISIICDSTTTAISNYHFLTVQFQFCHRDDFTKKIEVKVVHYRLIHLPNANDGSAEYQLKWLIKHFKDDRIYEFMKRNTIGRETFSNTSFSEFCNDANF